MLCLNLLLRKVFTSERNQQQLSWHVHDVVVGIMIMIIIIMHECFGVNM